MSISSPLKQNMARKILVTLSGGLVAFLIADFISMDLAIQVAASVFVGGVLFVSVYLVEVDQRLAEVEIGQAKHAEITQDLMTKGFNKINEATELFGQLEASALRTDMMTQLVKNSTRIDREASPLIFSFAQGEIARLSKLLRELGNDSDVPYEGEDRDWMLGLTRHASSTIDAISLTTVDAGIDGGLWTTDLGQRYLQTQQEAVHRGVKIRRIFVTDRASSTQDTDFQSMCGVHSRMGIEVRVLDAADAPGTRANTMFDFIVFDESLSYESTPASVPGRSRQPIIINTRLVQDRERVEDRVRRFQELWTVAQEIS